MTNDDLLLKLDQIEEQTNYLVAEPKALTKERLLMIVALIRQVRASLQLKCRESLPSGDDETIPFST